MLNNIGEFSIVNLSVLRTNCRKQLRFADATVDLVDEAIRKLAMQKVSVPDAVFPAQATLRGLQINLCDKNISRELL